MLVIPGLERMLIVDHPLFSSLLAEERQKVFFDEANRERMLFKMPAYNRSRRKLWVPLAAFAPIVFLILWLTVFA
jgi:hypothetical protein